jgi:hypothetical protein
MKWRTTVDEAPRGRLRRLALEEGEAKTPGTAGGFSEPRVPTQAPGVPIQAPGVPIQAPGVPIQAPGVPIQAPGVPI